MNPTAFDLSTLSLELGVLAVAGLVFIIDLLPGESVRRRVPAVASIGLAAVLLASFTVPGLEHGAFGESYVTDLVGLYFKRVLLLAGLLTVIGSTTYVERSFSGRRGEHYLLLLLSLSGMLLLTGACDALTWIVALELSGMPLYVLVGLRKNAPGTEAALKLYLTGVASTAFTLYGFSMIWGVAGDTSFATLASVEPQPLFVLGVLAVLAGVGFKIGAVPFHLWMADTYEGAPTPTTAFLSVAPKIAVIAGLVRLLLEGLLPLDGVWMAALMVLAVLAMVQGNLSALPQTDIRRLLALSGVAHMGLLMVALAAGTVEGLATLLFYTLAYVVTNMGAFFVVSAVVDAPGSGATGSGAISSFDGLARRSPGLGFALLLFLLSLGGIPFVAGFWAKLLIFWAAWKAGFEGIVVLGAVLAVVGLFYYLKVARAIYIERPRSDEGLSVDRATLAVIWICAAAVVGIGLAPGLFVTPAFEAARLLFP